MRKTILLLILLISYKIVNAQTTLVSLGSSWKYLDNGSNQGTAWRETSFNDTSWPSGNAQLGYGDGDEATVLKYGPSSSNKYITTYFRKIITVADASLFKGYTLNVKRDDGIVVYINGTERYRNNMPSGSIAYNTNASTACSDDGNTIQTTTIPTGPLLTGANTLAVEIHQSGGTSSDISFDLELVGLTGNTGTSLTRGPYLQMATSSSMIVRWRSSTTTNSKVGFGTVEGILSSSVSDVASVIEHEVKLTGLLPETKYYYSIGSSTQVLEAGPDNFFITAPVIGAEKKTRIWITGDCGNNSTNQKNVKDKYYSYAGANIPDVWMLLGDNAYSNGTEAEYQGSFFNVYKDKILKQVAVWPAPGNHDYANDGSRQNDHNVPYYKIFSLPQNAEAGGVASKTEAFYSYNYANIHFIALDSYGKESNTTRLYDTLGTQVTWLKRDLAANTQKWTIVYFHHPPYTMGSHNSDTEAELIKIRQNLLRILERYKVDLIFCGHSHSYERSKLMMGHFGNEASFSSSSHNLSTSSGKYDGTASSCPYMKNAESSYNGTVYVVAGSAGQLGGTQASWPHAAMEHSDASNGGSMAIEVEQNRLDAKWICADGVIRDQFTLFKDVNKTTNIAITQGQSVILKASWVGNYTWTPGNATSRSITVSPSSFTSYTVKDNYGCVMDIFNITVHPAVAGANISDENPVVFDLNVFPNPSEDFTTLEYTLPASGQVIIALYDASGNMIKSLFDGFKEKGIHSYSFRSKSENIPAGTFLMKISLGNQMVVERVSFKP